MPARTVGYGVVPTTRRSTMTDTAGTPADREPVPNDAPSSGPFEDGSEESGTASGDPLAGVGTPDEEPVYPEGSDDA
jgi:hypothetical protein